MQYIFYDFETSGSSPIFDQILQAGAIVSKDFKTVSDKIELNCRLKKTIIPAPKALLINRISIDQLKSNQKSLYTLIEELKNKFESWSPGTFVGHNSLAFDEDCFRSSLFQNFFYPYLTTSKENKRMDTLRLSRCAGSFAPNSIAIPLSEDGKPNFKLENLTKVNQINHGDAHTALNDTLACFEIAKKIKTNAPDIWDAISTLKDGRQIGEKFHNENFVCYQDLIFGKIYNFAACFVCFHPVYGQSWLAAFDLKHDPRPLLDLNFSELKTALFSRPAKIRQVALNKMPIVLSKDRFSFLENYKEIGEEEINKRASLVRENKEFCDKVWEILEERGRERQESKSQDPKDYFPENSLHESTIKMSQKDKPVFAQFQRANWEEKAKIYSNFQDKVLQHFGRYLIYEEQPDALTQDVLKLTEKEIAEKLLTTDTKPYITIPDAQKKIDDLRAEEDSDKKFLNNYDLFIRDLEAKHKKNL